jgi:hypothetical protein
LLIGVGIKHAAQPFVRTPDHLNSLAQIASSYAQKHCVKLVVPQVTFPLATRQLGGGLEPVHLFTALRD